MTMLRGFTDALGNLIEVGKIYGYSQRSNGILRVVIGEATHDTPTKVSLNIIKLGRCLYGNPVEFRGVDDEKVTVIANSLFEVSLQC